MVSSTDWNVLVFGERTQSGWLRPASSKQIVADAIWNDSMQNETNIPLILQFKLETFHHYRMKRIFVIDSLIQQPRGKYLVINVISQFFLTYRHW